MDLRQMDNTITAYADYGWKLSYLKGKIQSMQTPPPKGSDGLQKGRKLDFVYMNGRVSGIRVDGIEKLSVEYDSLTGEAKALVVNSKRIEIELDQKPRVQNINGQNLVGGMERSLHRLRLADGTVKTYEFGVDGKLRPTLKVSGHSITWDPKMKTILKDNEWVYDIKADEKNPMANAAIGRRNKNGFEYWHHDGQHGQEIVEKDGIKRVTSWFVTGPAVGKLRKVEEIVNGKSTIIQKLAYDEKGRLLRHVDRFGNIESFTYKDGKRISSKDPTPEQLAEEEKQWIKKIAKAETPDAKEDSLYELGLFYATKMSAPSKAQDLALRIKNPLKQFNVFLYSCERDGSLSKSAKIQYLKKLLSEYPQQATLLNEVIKARENES